MGKIKLPQDFKEFLKLLEDEGVQYLLIGGYAVGYYGYPRATADIDIWIATSAANAQKVKRVFNLFGMDTPELTAKIFETPEQIIRMGLPPVRIEVLTSIDGVSFADCYKHRVMVQIDELFIPMISLEDLKKNKKASGRYKDLDDLEHLK